MTKDLTFYSAHQAAMTSYCERHFVNRGHFADILGFNGENANIQLSNCLNPNSDKTLNDKRKELLFHAYDDISKRVFFDVLMRPSGYTTCKIESVEPVELNIFHMLADDAMIEGDEAFKTIKMSLRDKMLDEKELIAIENDCKKTKELYRELEEQARARRVEEFGGM